MPGLTITTGGSAPATGATGAHGAASHPHPHPNPQPTTARRGSRASSPSRPPVSPITPTLGPSQLPGAGAPNFSPLSSSANNIPNFAQGRPIFTHSQPDQVGITPAQLPQPEPISFDDNPDVLALKSAISILQLQRMRAQADMQALSRAKAAALADPTAFIADLEEGRVSTEGDPLISGSAARGVDGEDSDDDDDDSSSSDSSEDDDEEQEDGESTTTKPNPTRKNIKSKLNHPAPTNPPKTWRKLPKPQTVVRCPPINWSQYGVVGESLDKLHAEQIAAPSPGAPVPLGPGTATFEFKAAGATAEQILRGDDRQGQRLPGIAAPYTPGRDKIEKEKERKGRAGAGAGAGRR